MFLIIGLQDDTTKENQISVRNIPEFAKYDFDETEPDPLNPVRRGIPFECINGYIENGICKQPFSYQKSVRKSIKMFKTNYFGIERNFLRNPISACEILLRIDYSLYLICRSVLQRNIECELNLLKLFGKTLLQKFWFHNIFAVHEDEFTVFGAQFAINETYG